MKKKYKIDRNKEAVINYYFKQKEIKEKNNNKKEFLKYLGIYFAVVSLITIIFANQGHNYEIFKEIGGYLNFGSYGQYIFWIIAGGLIVPILEELLFRKGYGYATALGIFGKIFKKEKIEHTFKRERNIKTNIIDIYFIIGHSYQYIGGGIILGIQGLLMFTFLTYLLREVYIKMGLKYSILLHIINNCFAFATMYEFGIFN